MPYKSAQKGPDWQNCTKQTKSGKCYLFQFNSFVFQGVDYEDSWPCN